VVGSEPKESSKDLLSLADKVFCFEKGNFQLPEGPVLFVNNHWKFKSA
jgi:hypothetical protein